MYADTPRGKKVIIKGKAVPPEIQNKKINFQYIAPVTQPIV